jgi:geranylgeranylglycerol-phosphate geranylgeranyltransferase
LNILAAHVKLFRPLNLFIGAFSVFISSAILKSLGNTQGLSLALLTVIFYNAGANALNDFIDQKTDQLNRPDRPIPSAAVSPKSALTSSMFLFIFGSVSASFLPLHAIIIAILIVLPLIILYNLKLKQLPLIGNITIALILGLTFIFSGTVFGNIKPMIIPCLLAFGLTLVRELVKDIEDMKGDHLAGLTTFPIIAGVNCAGKLTALLAVMIGVGALTPYVMGIYSVWYLAFLVFGVEIPLVTLVVLFMKSPNELNFSFASKALKISTILGIVAIYFGTAYA